MLSFTNKHWHLSIKSKFAMKFMTTVYLLMGSNLGDRERHLQSASREIGRLLGPIITTSSVYKTAAWGNTDQPDFYNQVVILTTERSPTEALQVIQQIERQSGRERKEKWGSRTIDIDILFWGNQIISTPELIIPHPGIPQRRFTLIPLLEIAPDFIHPVLNKSIHELLQDCTDRLSVEKVF